MPNQPTLFIFAGLPGSGKTTIARQLAARTGAFHVRIDSIESALKLSMLQIENPQDAGYRAAYTVARDNLVQGKIVIADSVNPLDTTRNAWRQIAIDAEAASFEIEIICSDEHEHQRRVESRTSDIAGLTVPNWQAVLDRDYQPWDGEHMVLDTATLSIANCVDNLVQQMTPA